MISQRYKPLQPVSQNKKHKNKDVTLNSPYLSYNQQTREGITPQISFFKRRNNSKNQNSVENISIEQKRKKMFKKKLNQNCVSNVENKINKTIDQSYREN